MTDTNIFPQGHLKDDKEIDRLLHNKTSLREILEKKTDQNPLIIEDADAKARDEALDPWKDDEKLIAQAKLTGQLHNPDTFEYNANIGGLNKPFFKQSKPNPEL